VLGAFTVVAVVVGDAEGRAPLDKFNGLGRRSPWLAAVMTFLLLAMAGIPVTAGFVGKVAVFSVAVEAGYLWLVIVALVAAVAGLFFYLRVIVRMYMEEPEGEAGVSAAGAGARVVLALASAATLVLGVAPWPLLRVLRADATLLMQVLRHVAL
jgi:NADH-quinone oxidoreductase subunit N